MVTLRDYQLEALTALEQHWNSGGTAALIDMATATGKSVVLAETMRRAIAADPQARLLLAVHVRELVEQDVAALLSIWPDAPYGVCSDGLDRRDHDQQIILGTIQTLFRDAHLLGRRDLLLIDEVQLVPRDGDGMYLSLIDTLRARSPDLRMVGASATCFRLDSGYLDRGDGALFERTVFSYGIKQGIEDGWLAKLSSKATTTRIDVTGVGRRGGEFIPGELERAANVADVVEGAVAEIVEQGADRRSWLAFCAGVDHAYAVRDALRRARHPMRDRGGRDRERGAARHLRCLSRRGDPLPDRRQRVLGRLQYPGSRSDRAVAPDLLARIADPAGRPRHPQGGRQSRLPDPRLRRQHPPPRAGRCHLCQRPYRGRSRRRAHQDVPGVPGAKRAGGRDLFLLRPRIHQRRAPQDQACRNRRRGAGVVRRTGDLAAGAAVRISHPSQGWQPGAPPTLRVDHLCGFAAYSEYVAFEGSSGARYYAGAWWHAMGGDNPVPLRVADAFARRDELNDVTDIVVDRNGQWWRIAKRRVRRADGSIIEVDGKYRVRRLVA